MKKFLVFFTALFLSTFTFADSRENFDEIKADYVEKFTSCIYTTEKYANGRPTGHSIILGDDSFEPKSKYLKNESLNSKCVYFTLYTGELKPGITELRSEDGAFEGGYIDHGYELEFKLDSPLECEFDGKMVHIKGVARLYEHNSSRKSGKILKFTYDGPVSKGLFLDLWPNPSYKILEK